MNMFLSLSILISLILMMVSHPIAILALILMQTMNLCLIIWCYISINWFAYILFLIFLGGLMVLFMYVTSLASNEKFEMSVEEAKSIYLIFLFLTTIATMSFIFLHNEQPNLLTLSKQSSVIFNQPIYYLTMLVMTYLLITLIVAVKITSKFEGPLRNIFKK